jgi:hypothetical protein
MMRKILVTSLLLASITTASAKDPHPKPISLDDALAKADQKTLTQVEDAVAEFSRLTLANGFSNIKQCLDLFRSQNSDMNPEEQEELGHIWCLEKNAQGSDQVQANATAPTSGTPSSGNRVPSESHANAVTENNPSLKQ